MRGINLITSPFIGPLRPIWWGNKIINCNSSSVCLGVTNDDKLSCAKKVVPRKTCKKVVHRKLVPRKSCCRKKTKRKAIVVTKKLYKQNLMRKIQWH